MLGLPPAREQRVLGQTPARPRHVLPSSHPPFPLNHWESRWRPIGRGNRQRGSFVEGGEEGQRVSNAGRPRCWQQHHVRANASCHTAHSWHGLVCVTLRS